MSYVDTIEVQATIPLDGSEDDYPVEVRVEFGSDWHCIEEIRLPSELKNNHLAHNWLNNSETDDTINDKVNDYRLARGV